MNLATPEVLAMGEIHLEGNVIPQSWYQHLKLDTGRPDMESIIILSEIVYWYRPTYVRNEQTGSIEGVTKKFSGDALQRSKKSFADQFGFSEKKVQESLARLEKDGLITRDYRTVKILDGVQMSNVLFIKIHPEKIKAISFQKSHSYGRNLPDPYPKSTSELEEIYHNTYITTDNKKKKKKKNASLPSIEFDYETNEFVNIQQSDLDEWSKLYEGVKVDLELRKMRQWLMDPKNPERDGNRTFVTNWLSKAAKDSSKAPKKPKVESSQEPSRNSQGNMIPYNDTIASNILKRRGLEEYVSYLKEVEDQSHYKNYLNGKFPKFYIDFLESKNQGDT